MNNPARIGHYLLLAFEWVGLANAKPAAPQWFIRKWDGKHWEGSRYQWDTGGYEQLEPVAWQELPFIGFGKSDLSNEAVLARLRKHCEHMEQLVKMLKHTTNDPKTNVYQMNIDRLEHEIGEVRIQLDYMP